MTTPTILELFPVPFLVFNTDYDQKEFKMLKKYVSDLNNLDPNSSKNYSSKDSFILDRVPKTKKLIKNAIKYYSEEILHEATPLRLTQSWLNFNPPGTSHHQHIHSNSIVSGIIYLQCDADTGNLHVHRPNYQVANIRDEPTDFGLFNTEFMFFTPGIGDLFLFPSTLSHNVSENKSSQNRISLSFNTFYGETFGSAQAKTLADVSRLWKKK